jgi:excisionase family DNA binding protein
MSTYLSVAQAAEITGLQPRTIRDAINDGRLAAVRPRGVRRQLILRAALDAWLEPVAPAPAPLVPAPRASTEIGSRGRLRALEER